LKANLKTELERKGANELKIIQKVKPAKESRATRIIKMARMPRINRKQRDIVLMKKKK
jgi:hypothetical protein